MSPPAFSFLQTLFAKQRKEKEGERRKEKGGGRSCRNRNLKPETQKPDTSGL